MTTLAQELEKADRLALVTQRIGFTLWQLQELEGVAASYFVLVAQARKGMGLAVGNALVEEAQGKTFGVTLRQISKAGLLSSEIAERFTQLLSERNWLVHRSRADSRNVIYDSHALEALLVRLDAVADEAFELLKCINVETMVFARRQGVSMQDVELVSKQLLDQWHAADEP